MLCPTSPLRTAVRAGTPSISPCASATSPSPRRWSSWPRAPACGWRGRRGGGGDARTGEVFGRGAGPEAWDALLRYLRGRGFPVALLERAGLVQARSGGEGHFDFLRHRLIFPIQDLQDRTVAFGGRALDDATPKYLNSRESPAFNKGRMLYALNWAREAIREAGEVVIVEGYMDVVTCHKSGIRHAVASLGAALTPDHVPRL